MSNTNNSGMARRVRRALFIIDPQVDFMEGGSLPVPGATADMQRLATAIDNRGEIYDEIFVSLDSHHTMDGRHPEFWRDAQGNHPIATNLGGPLISSQDIKSGIWTPVGANSKPKVLGGLTVREFMVQCAEHRESEGVPGLEIWTPHCCIGSHGATIQADLYAALQRWERRFKTTVNFLVKGVNPYSEHYGALCANDPLSADPSTGLNLTFLKTIDNFDETDLAGEAATHCLLTTVTQVADNIGDVSKLRLLTDCTSPIPAIPGVDFPQIYQDWRYGMVKRGLRCAVSTAI